MGTRLQSPHPNKSGRIGAFPSQPLAFSTRRAAAILFWPSDLTDTFNPRSRAADGCVHRWRNTIQRRQENAEPARAGAVGTGPVPCYEIAAKSLGREEKEKLLRCKILVDPGFRDAKYQMMLPLHNVVT